MSQDVVDTISECDKYCHYGAWETLRHNFAWHVGLHSYCRLFTRAYLCYVAHTDSEHAFYLGADGARLPDGGRDPLVPVEPPCMKAEPNPLTQCELYVAFMVG